MKTLICVAFLLSFWNTSYADKEAQSTILAIDDARNATTLVTKANNIVNGAHSNCPQIPASDIPQFCEEPYKAICANTESHRSSILGHLDDIRKKSEQQAMEFIAKKYSLTAGDELMQKLKSTGLLAFGDQNLTQQYRDDFFEKTRELEASYSEKADKEFQESHFQIIKVNLKRAIEASSLPTEKKQKFLSYIDREQFTSSDNIFNHKQDMKYAELFGRALQICDSDGLKPLAVADDTDQTRAQGNQTLLICSGRFAFHTKDDLPIEHLANEFQVAAHEMSHIMSYHWEPQMYRGLRKCVQNRNASQIVSEYLQALKDNQSYTEEGAKNIEENKTAFVDDHLEEYTPDFWAKGAIVQYFKNEGKSLSPTEKLNFLQNAYGYFCGSPESGDHPSGKLRIEMMGFDSNVRKQMGCTSPTKSPSCGL
ncbi:MAG TPA: hypothetical protein VF412_16845 [Bdellovibrio sp.]|uniref:hypothetical protein n=1 Tax=Bdellovibrio sp. TaxID=28201 RepID=UPI002EE437D8